MNLSSICACALLLAPLSAGADGALSAPPTPAVQYDAGLGGATASLLRELRSPGARVEVLGPVEQPFLAVTGTSATIGAELIQIFEYPSVAQAQAQAMVVSPDGSTIGTSQVHWLGPPHFFKRGRLLVLYVGDDRNTVAALEGALGNQFAGQ